MQSNSNEWLDDARKIPGEVMGYLRKIVVRAIEEKHYSPEAISDIFGIDRTAIYRWLRRYQEEGYIGLDTRESPGAPPIITTNMEEWLKETVLHSTPMDFGYDTILWTRDILAELLHAEFKINVTGRAVSNHLRNIGLSPQKPWFRPHEQNKEDVDRFVNDTFPRIQRLAIKIGADIAFEDEAGIGLRTNSGTTWGEVGKTPEVPASGTRGGYNMLSIVTDSGVLRFSIQDGTINSEKYISFLKQILAGRNRPLILIVDGASFHRSKKVKEFVRAHRKQIRMYFLPAYSPELNPDEQVWNEIKSKRLGRTFKKTKIILRKKLNSAFRSLQNNTARIKSFFQLPHTKYAVT